jgi:hypothetical protein
MSGPESISRIEAHRRIVQQPLIRERVMITPDYRGKNWIVVMGIGLFVGLVVSLFLIGCGNPAEPSAPIPRVPVHHIPVNIPR